MKSIRDELQEMANKLAIVPEDSEALKGLVEYAKTCEDRVDEILGIMDTEICPKVIFAATNDYELKEEDRILSAEIMDWPKRIASCLQNSYKMQSNEKRSVRICWSVATKYLQTSLHQLTAICDLLRSFIPFSPKRCKERGSNKDNHIKDC